MCVGRTLPPEPGERWYLPKPSTDTGNRFGADYSQGKSHGTKGVILGGPDRPPPPVDASDERIAKAAMLARQRMREGRGIGSTFLAQHAPPASRPPLPGQGGLSLPTSNYSRLA